MAIGGVQNSFDIQEYVSQLMEYEKRPLYALQSRKTTMESQISTWDTMNSSLKKLQDTLNVLQLSSTFKSMLTTSSDPSYVTATADVNSAETTYTFSDITLAQSASKTSTSGIGLLSGVAASIASTEEIITGGGSANANSKLADLNLTLDPGKSIVSGSFYINGRKIDVIGDDTIYTILSKINSSGANVTATFENDTISITQKTEGYTYSIRMNDDTTGFFDAVKLSDGSDPDTAFGVDHDYNRDIEDTVLSGSISNGYFNINNITIAVDVTTDSIADLVNRINASEAGVLAYFDSVDNKITLTSVVDGQDIVISNDSTGLFSNNGLNILEDTYTGTDSIFTLNGQTLTRSSNTFELNGTTFTLRSSSVAGDSFTVTVQKDTDKTEGAIDGFIEQYNDTLKLMNDEIATGKPLEKDRKIKSIIRQLRTMITGTVENSGELNHLSEIGLTLSHNSIDKKLKLDSSVLLDAINENVDDIFSLFADDIDGNGIFGVDDQGVSATMDYYLEFITKRFSGYVVNHNDATRSSITRLDRRIERMEEQMDAKEQSLIDEFTELQEAMAKLDQQSYAAVSVISQFSQR